jgi:hypothetical protein
VRYLTMPYKRICGRRLPANGRACNELAGRIGTLQRRGIAESSFVVVEEFLGSGFR